jgi:two-component system nitrogen regulation sensor histidine kinase NtrY
MQLAARRSNVFAIMEVVAILAFLAMTVTTWMVLTTTQTGRRELLPSSLTASLLIGTLVPAMAILVLLGRRMALRRAAETIGGTGRMHTQLVFIFSMVAALPTLLVVIFASFLFQQGVEFWFSDNSRGMLENANKLAQGYYEQSQRDVGNETRAMAIDVRAALSESTLVDPRFSQEFSRQIVLRKLDEVAILEKGADGRLRTAATTVVDEKDTGAPVTPEELRRIDEGAALIVNADANRIEAITPIDREAGVYLYAARTSDPLAFGQGQRAENIVRAYQVLTQRARILQLQFNVALFIASLALVGLAVWVALRFADRQVKPLYQLVSAARSVGAGNYALRIEGRQGADEIGLLNRAFNRMTEQIERQTQALVSANSQLDERRSFIEAVLESVTAGIVSLDSDGSVLLMNSSAQQLLLERPGPTEVGIRLPEIAPQLADMIATSVTGGIIQHGKGGELLTLAVKISRDAAGHHVITFEDITRQLIDQRQAAWSDVARRIAHEIKNPLTPIQLATERLNRRYRKQILTDPELFEELTATIIRQVGDLRKMVDEFSSFARLPKPVFRREDPVDLARQSLFLQEVARPDIDFAFAAAEDIDTIACDRHQFGQAMTNVLKNAVEAIEARAKVAEAGYRGKVSVTMELAGDLVEVRVADNGIGLPQDRERIVEPYVTTREKGTGLGLAIVNKIVEEHGGDMTFSAADTPGGGTQVCLRFARDPLSRQRASEAAE